MNEPFANASNPLERIGGDPRRRPAEWPLLTDGERQPPLAEPNDAQQQCPNGQYVHQIVEAQAKRRPHAVAVVFEGQRLTYGELNARADQLANHLRIFGVGPDVVVGICLKRSLAAVVGALGILKTGGAYLPLDPAYPAARLGFQLRDAQVSVLVTGSCMTELLPAGSWRIVALDPQGRQINSHTDFDNCEETPEIEVQGGNLAYVIYTSGSTGNPKGVEITHESLRNLVSWHLQTFAVTSDDRATLQSSPGFDAAVWELWPYLMAGASLCIPDDDIRSNPERLREWLVENAITITFVPTVMAERLIQLQWPSNTALRIMLTGADTLRRYPPPTLPFAVVNNYGPTECTVVSTSGKVPPNGSGHLPPIGRPITNTEIYILDERLQQLPLGSPGELYIGGVGLARGYRNRPDLTAERFIPTPFNKRLGSRLYKTGDIGCFLPDGQLAFLGRIDDQVKIRGYRIEPDEIVAVLDGHPMVQASTVVTQEDDRGDKQLVAYVVPRPGDWLTDKVLREFMLLYLPEYMVPGVFCRLDKLPLTPSGKVDRKALPPLTEAHLLRSGQYVAPRTPVQERVANIAAALLGVERVGLDDNFFLIGGNSLRGAQVIARVRDTLGVELTLLNLFDYPTVAGLAAEIERLLVAKLDAMSEEEAERLAAGLNSEKDI